MKKALHSNWQRILQVSLLATSTAPEWENSMAILNNRQEVTQRPAEMSHLLATVAVKPPLEQQWKHTCNNIYVSVSQNRAQEKDGSGKDDVPEVQHTGHKTGDKGIATSSRVCLGRSRNKNLEEHSIRSVDTGQGHTEGTSAIQKSSIPLGLSLLPISL